MATGKRTKKLLSDEIVAKYMKSEYVTDYEKVTGSFVYTDEFYEKMYDLTENQDMTAVDAYKELGFDTRELGRDRANACRRRAIKKHEPRHSSTPQLRRFDPEMDPALLPVLSHEEEIQFWKDRSDFYKLIAEYQKKRIPF